jgi:ABC-type transporter Mla maintaining outer membrane lipid asymmetry ATPase subunit MlaF
VLKDMSFEVQPGEIFVIMGPSGSGKSVLLRHIVGLEIPTSGKITVDGLDPSLEETRERVRSRSSSRTARFSTRSASTTTWRSTRASTAPATRTPSARGSCTR